MQNTTEDFDIAQIIYCSYAVEFHNTMLFEQIVKDIVIFGQINNFLYEITSALMTDGEMFAHVIEGPKTMVEKLYANIINDKRHRNVMTLQCVPTHVRLFNHWPIAFLKVENMHYLRTLNTQSTSTELRNASVSILKVFRPVLLR